jgi:hypothetical protein
MYNIILQKIKIFNPPRSVDHITSVRARTREQKHKGCAQQGEFIWGKIG